MHQVVFPVASPEEFLHVVVNHVTENFKRYESREALIHDLLSTGVAKFDFDHLDTFVKSLVGRVYLPAMIVQKSFQDEFFWMVCGSQAILIKRP